MRVTRLGITALSLAIQQLWSAGAGAQTGPTRISWNRALDQPFGWCASAEAVRIADNVLLYQHD